MKRIFLILALCLLLCTCAAAETTLEQWNTGADSRVSQDAAVYHLPTAEGEPLIILPRGTLVQIISREGEWSFVDYYAGGMVCNGAVRSDCLVSIDGSATPVPEPTPTPIPLATAIPSLFVAETPAPTQSSGLLMLIPVSDEPTPEPAPYTITGGRLTVSVIGESGTAQAQLITLGANVSTVVIAGTLTEIPTSAVHCSDAMAEDRQVCVINAKRSGKASLRLDASTRSDAIQQLQDGEMVCVLGAEGDFYEVFAHGVTGYIASSVADFDAIVAEPVGHGMICTAKGKTTGSGTVNIRAAAKKNATRVDDWQIGTEVTVLASVKGWYLVESNGCRGYVQTQYVKMN